MRIELLPEAEGDVVAYEILVGNREGDFRIHPGGEIWYHHPLSPPLFANPDESSSRAASEAWRAYGEADVDPENEVVHHETVARLRAHLEQGGAQAARGDSFWAVILEQAESGIL
jgi:hypothetical protein